MKNNHNHRALITGASSGIGREIALLLAEQGFDLVLTARRKERLDELKAKITVNHSALTVDTISADLATPSGASELWEKASSKPITTLINNAGFGAYHSFATTPWERTESLLQLNIHSLVKLTHKFLNQSSSPSDGYIMNIASVLSFTSMKHFATYAASKAFVRSFSESVADELDKSNISMTCVSPGPVDTEFHDVSGSVAQGFAKRLKLSPEKCAQIAVHAMFKRRRHVTPGFMAKAMVTGMCLTPSGFLGNFSGKFLPKPE